MLWPLTSAKGPRSPHHFEHVPRVPGTTLGTSVSIVVLRAAGSSLTLLSLSPSSTAWVLRFWRPWLLPLTIAVLKVRKIQEVLIMFGAWTTLAGRAQPPAQQGKAAHCSRRAKPCTVCTVLDGCLTRVRMRILARRDCCRASHTRPLSASTATPLRSLQATRVCVITASWPAPPAGEVLPASAGDLQPLY